MSALAPRFSCAPCSSAAAGLIARALGLSPTTAEILVRRGYDTVDAAAAFLAADQRHDPFALDGMRDACELVLRHVTSRSRIVVHGDYDVDGVCSTAILVETLRNLGADPSWHLPSRFEEGYGLSAGTVSRLAAEGTGLLLTVDCGITAHAEVDVARQLGMDVLVTDHHRPGAELPPCPVLHPVLGGYPFAELCAAGVAHKLAQALYVSGGHRPERADEHLDLVALATVADLVPLVGENRRLVREGLRALARTPRPGLRALMAISAVGDGEVSAHAAGFRLAPRLNAAGRLQRADAALELLLTADQDRAAEVADELDLLNRDRREAETRILFEAEAARAEQPDAPAYVLAGEGWHPGVIGIVASRMVERHHRPCVLVSLGPDGGRGSGRSIDAYDLHAGLSAAAEHLRRFGGHRMAAGLEMEPGQLEGFRSAFVAHAAARLGSGDLVPVQRVDAVVGTRALGLALAEELERLAPFGQGNPAPTLLVPSARVGHPRPMGQEDMHATFTVESGGVRARGVAFRTPARSLVGAGEGPHHVAVRLEANEWNGSVEPRLVLRSLGPAEPGGCEVLDDEEPFWAALERRLRAAPGGPRAGLGRAEHARPLRDRRGEGLVAVGVSLAAAGERVLVVVADVHRRRAALERLIAGAPALCQPAGAALGLCSWDALADRPQAAEPYEHLLAFDPPEGPWGEALVSAAPAPPGGGWAHLGWGPAEVRFARAAAEWRLDLRARLTELYRDLRAAGTAGGEDLRSLLEGAGRHPRPVALCGRLLGILVELGLIEYVPAAAGGPSCRVLDAPRTSLERSERFRAAAAELAEARSHLERAARGADGRQVERAAAAG